MDTLKINNMIQRLAQLNYQDMYLNDFLLTWEKSDDEVAATFLVADILRGMREQNISSRIFDSGLGISLFRDRSTRTRMSLSGYARAGRPWGVTAHTPTNSGLK